MIIVTYITLFSVVFCQLRPTQGPSVFQELVGTRMFRYVRSKDRMACFCTRSDSRFSRIKCERPAIQELNPETEMTGSGGHRIVCSGGFYPNAPLAVMIYEAIGSKPSPVVSVGPGTFRVYLHGGTVVTDKRGPAPRAFAFQAFGCWCPSFWSQGPWRRLRPPWILFEFLMGEWSTKDIPQDDDTLIFH